MNAGSMPHAKALRRLDKARPQPDLCAADDYLVYHLVPLILHRAVMCLPVAMIPVILAGDLPPHAESCLRKPGG